MSQTVSAADTLAIDTAPLDRFTDAVRGRSGNTMARERMSFLHDMSRAHRALVVGSS